MSEEDIRKFVVTEFYPGHGPERIPIAAGSFDISEAGYLYLFRPNGEWFLTIPPGFWAQIQEVKGEEKWS